LRYVVAGAEKLSEEVRRLWIEKFGIRVARGYGERMRPGDRSQCAHGLQNRSVGQLAPVMQYELEPVPGIEDAGVLHVSGRMS